jgi:hypothetical protein
MNKGTYNMNKVILTDCDGVLLDWEYAFETWMKDKGYIIKHREVYDQSERFGIGKNELKGLIRDFNESAMIGFLPSLRDSIHYVKELHQKKGYIFHCITSLSKSRYAQELRTQNLKKLFGQTVFDRFVYLDTGADKDKVLNEYRDSGYIWVEDKLENAIQGELKGLTPVLMEHRHNMTELVGNAQIPRVKNWKEIYDML